MDTRNTLLDQEGFEPNMKTNNKDNAESFLPPLTSPFEQTADMDNVVKVVSKADKRTTKEAKPIPAWPTTQDSRKYSITPHILRRMPSSTPLIQPGLLGAVMESRPHSRDE